MVTTLSIILAVLIVLCVWISIATLKRATKNERLLQERINEFNKASEAHVAELQGARYRVEEAIAETAKIKANYEALLKEHEKIVQAYKELRKECENAQNHTVSGDPHAGHQDPVNVGDVTVATTTAGEKKEKGKKVVRKAKRKTK